MTLSGDARRLEQVPRRREVVERALAAADRPWLLGR